MTSSFYLKHTFIETSLVRLSVSLLHVFISNISSVFLGSLLVDGLGIAVIL